MKKLALFSIGLLISGVILASTVPFSTGPAPTQSYHSASTDVQPQATVIPQSALAQMPTQTPAPAPTPTSTQDTPDSASIIGSAGTNTSAQNQISRLAQTTLTYEQQNDQRIQNLDNSNQVIGTELQAINQNIAKLQQKMNESQTGSPMSLSGFFHAMNEQDLMTFIAFGVASVFLLGLGVVMGRLMNRTSHVDVLNAKRNHTVGDLLSDDTKSEYDFMSTAEAIPAKLDLARSYMVMRDYEQANVILKTVLEKGDEEQRMIAEALLTKIRNIKKI